MTMRKPGVVSRWARGSELRREETMSCEGVGFRRGYVAQGKGSNATNQPLFTADA
ncbi:hypothetical protein I3842_03G036700 [Carya illinoinensis]|uniref:Uncharacterized protein n=1 Tax=Carya illinoinensis TaxID=32201 RepID=A0A922FH21_CARIL|nr:hypothetical protein I3842_03G036700 [Carya illinoinensis]